MPSATSAAVPGIALGAGSNLGFVAFFLGLVLCSSVGVGVVGVDPSRTASPLLEVPGLAFVDGRALEAHAEVTRTRLRAPWARDLFVSEPRDCVFVHGETVRLLSAHGDQLHAANARCSAWLPAGWLSGAPQPAQGLLK